MHLSVFMCNYILRKYICEKFMTHSSFEQKSIISIYFQIKYFFLYNNSIYCKSILCIVLSIIHISLSACYVNKKTNLNWIILYHGEKILSADASGTLFILLRNCNSHGNTFHLCAVLRRFFLNCKYLPYI